MTSTRTSRRPRLFRAAVLALVTAAVTLTPLAAHAGSGWDDTGPTGGKDNTGGGGGPVTLGKWDCGQNIGKVPGASYWWDPTAQRWSMQYDATYPNCINGGAPYAGNGKVKLCLSGYEVYRFYQKPGAKTPTAVTRSRLNLKDWCMTEPVYTFAAQTNWDATLRATSPGTPDFLAKTDSPSQKANYLPAQVGRRETGALTTGRPVKVGSRACTDVSRPNPMVDWFAGASAAEQVGFRAFLGQGYWDIATNGNKTYPASAAAAFGMKLVEGYKYSVLPDQRTHPGKAPTPDPDGKRYYASKFRFDHRACSTAWNFAKVTTSSTAANGSISSRVTAPGAVYGTCYIPLVRQAKQMASASGKTKWAFQALDRGFGERYSAHYKRIGDLGQKVPSSWRTAMRNDYAARVKAGIYGSDGQARIPAQVPPGDSDAKRIGQVSHYDATQAGKDLAAYAKCRFGDAVNLQLTGNGTPDPDVDAAVRLKMVTPAVLQSGGTRFQRTYTVTAGQDALICADGKPCGSRAQLTKVGYTLTPVGTGGYTQCGLGKSVGCDFKVLKTVKGSVNTPGSVTVEFYNATGPGQTFNVKVSALSATYSYISKGDSITLVGLDPVTGRPISYSTGNTTMTQVVDTVPTVTGSPTALKYDAKAKAYTVSLPVIAAVSVPQ